MSRMAKHAVKYGKHDLERLGLFIEMPYMNGKGYTSMAPKLNQLKGLNMLAGFPKIKCGTQAGYFDKDFKRLFIGEGIIKKKKKEEKKVSTRIFRPVGPSKKHATPGDHFGTFSGVIEAMSRKSKKVPPVKKEPANFKTNPGKKGGFGYVNICLSKYPEHLEDPYRLKSKSKEFGSKLNGPMRTNHYPSAFFDSNPYLENNPKGLRLYVRPKPKMFQIVGDGKWTPTGPAKWLGGCKAGTFSGFPVHMTERPKKPKPQLVTVSDKGLYLPQSTALKSMFTTSVLTLGVNISCNSVSHKKFEAKYTKRMLKPLM